MKSKDKNTTNNQRINKEVTKNRVHNSKIIRILIINKVNKVMKKVHISNNKDINRLICKNKGNLLLYKRKFS